MGKKQLSIIIPVYNLENYIERCLESIVSQVHDQVEIVIVNDGSIDQSENVCKRFCEQYSYVQYYFQENQGVSVARNTGIQKATGKYVMFVDGDDWILPGTINRILEKITKSDFDMIIGGYVKSKKKLSRLKNNSDKLIEEIECAVYPTNAQLVFKKNIYIPSLWGNIFKRNIFVNNKIELIPGIKYTEDLDCCLKLFLASHKFGVLSFPFYVYRVTREGSATSTISSKRMEDVINFVSYWNSFLKHSDLDEELKNEIMEFVSYEYVIALGLLYLLPKKERLQFFSKIKEYRYLLKNRKSKKVYITNFLINLIGCHMTGYMLAQFIKIKNR